MVFDIGGIVANLEPDYPEREKRSGQLPSNHGGLDFIVRLYQPRMEALDESWTFPSLEPVE